VAASVVAAFFRKAKRRFRSAASFSDIRRRSLEKNLRGGRVLARAAGAKRLERRPITSRRSIGGSRRRSHRRAPETLFIFLI